MGFSLRKIIENHEHREDNPDNDADATTRSIKAL